MRIEQGCIVSSRYGFETDDDRRRRDAIRTEMGREIIPVIVDVLNDFIEVNHVNHKPLNPAYKVATDYTVVPYGSSYVRVEHGSSNYVMVVHLNPPESLSGDCTLSIRLADTRISPTPFRTQAR